MKGLGKNVYDSLHRKTEPTALVHLILLYSGQAAGSGSGAHYMYISPSDHNITVSLFKYEAVNMAKY